MGDNKFRPVEAGGDIFLRTFKKKFFFFFLSPSGFYGELNYVINWKPNDFCFIPELVGIQQLAGQVTKQVTKRLKVIRFCRCVERANYATGVNGPAPNEPAIYRWQPTETCGPMRWDTGRPGGCRADAPMPMTTAMDVRMKRRKPRHPVAIHRLFERCTCSGDERFVTSTTSHLQFRKRQEKQNGRQFLPYGCHVTVVVVELIGTETGDRS